MLFARKHLGRDATLTTKAHTSWALALITVCQDKLFGALDFSHWLQILLLTTHPKMYIKQITTRTYKATGTSTS